MNSSMQVYDLLGFVYRQIVDTTFVSRESYDNLLRAAAEVYRENMQLRRRLKELERLASSWTGTPERHPEIVQAREILRNQS